MIQKLQETVDMPGLENDITNDFTVGQISWNDVGIQLKVFSHCLNKNVFVIVPGKPKITEIFLCMETLLVFLGESDVLIQHVQLFVYNGMRMFFCVKY